MPAPLTQEQITEYSDKWLTGTITDEEKKILEQWYNEHPSGTYLWDTAETRTELRERIFDRITNQIRDEAHVPVRRTRKAFLLAAASIILVLASVSIVLFVKPLQKKDELTVNIAVESPVKKTVTYTRSITLQDGSVVVLHANSSLSYPAKFTGNTREVTLTGEAYFDINHDSKPFIIHTGNVKTIVLGTAFNIKAYPDSKDITISVVRGKVRVENKEKTLAVLTPDQQITCDNTIVEKTQTRKVDATALITDWTKQDMVFEDISLQTVADLLSRRYGVTIGFNKPGLAKCTIKAFFDGTEPLDNVLKSLCLISNSTYTMPEKDKIILDGEGCNE